jgi:surfeit locus 1 family protein
MADARRFPVVLTAVCAMALAILVSLGVWQLQRLAWKEDLLARVAAAQTAEPVPLDAALARPDPAFARVVLTCRGLDRAPFVELYAIEDGEPGSRLISLCDAGTPILVDRGFVAATISARPPVDDASTMPVVLRGVLREGQAPGPFTPAGDDTMLYARDIPALAARLGVQGANPRLMVVAESSTNPEWQALRPVAVPTGLTNNHLGYALTWFGLAAALAGVWLAMVLRKPKA